MNYLSDPLLRLGCSAGTAEGFNGLVSAGVMALSVVGIIVIAAGILWQIPHAWRQVLAGKGAQHLENPVASRGPDPAPPANDIPPTSDI